MIRFEPIIEQGVNKLASVLQGGAFVANISQPIAACMSVGVKSYMQLSNADRKQLEDLVTTTMQFIASLRKHYPKLKEYTANINVDKVTSLFKVATKLLRKKATADIVQKYMEVYMQALDNPRKMKAIGAYVSCLVSNIDPKFKSALIASIEFAFAAIQLLSQTDTGKKLAAISQSAHKHILRPLYREIRKKST